MNIAIFLFSISLLLAPLLAAMPDEPQWSAFLSALVLVSGIILLLTSKSDHKKVGSRSTAAVLVVAFVSWGLISVIGHLAVTKLAFASHMLKTWAMLLTYAAAFLSMRYLARNARGAAFAVALSAIGGATIASVIGMQEYLAHVRAGESTWRIFGTSSPDFLAGYLILVAPVTIGAVLAIPKGNSLRLLIGIAAFLQAATIFPTGSRFALVSLALGLIVLGVALIRARTAHGGRVKLSPKSLAAALVILAVGGVLARPVIHRLQSGGPENSGQFRLYTWHGTIDMAKANPLIGTGPGTFIDYYPRYALAGFTRLAHETYLQIAAEIGLPALLLLIAVIVVVVASLWRSLGRSDAYDASGPMSRLAELPSSAYPGIAAGLLAGIVAEVLQNLIDSDLYVFAIGLTFWAFAGLASGLSEGAESDEASTRSTSPALRWAAAAFLLAGAVFSAMNGIAAADVAKTQSLLSAPNDSPADAAAAYRSAESMAPLDGKYPAEFGYRVLIQRQGDKNAGVAEIRRGVQLQPDSQNYLRLGSTLENVGDTTGAIKAYRAGLRQDPNRLELLLAIGRVSPPEQALAYYRKIADLEQSPVGKVRAIGEVTEQRFAVGDSAVADDALKRSDTRTAIDYYRRAIALLEKYADEDGSSFPERAASSGGASLPDMDQQSAALYDHASSALLGLLSGKDRDALAAEKQYYQANFNTVIGDASKSAGRASDAKTAYQNAQSTLSGCTHPKAANLKKDLDAKIQSLGQ